MPPKTVRAAVMSRLLRPQSAGRSGGRRGRFRPQSPSPRLSPQRHLAAAAQGPGGEVGAPRSQRRPFSTSFRRSQSRNRWAIRSAVGTLAAQSACRGGSWEAARRGSGASATAPGSSVGEMPLQPFLEQARDLLAPQGAADWMFARSAPASAAAARIASISLSVIAADRAEAPPPHPGGGQPAIVSSRRGGVAARGSSTRANPGRASSPTLQTFASPCAAIGARMSRSRKDQRRLGHDADRVAEIVRTRSIGALSFSCRSHRLVGIGVAPSAMSTAIALGPQVPSSSSAASGL